MSDVLVFPSLLPLSKPSTLSLALRTANRSPDSDCSILWICSSARPSDKEVSGAVTSRKLKSRGTARGVDMLSLAKPFPRMRESTQYTSGARRARRDRSSCVAFPSQSPGCRLHKFGFHLRSFGGERWLYRTRALLAGTYVYLKPGADPFICCTRTPYCTNDKSYPPRSVRYTGANLR